MHLGQVLHQLIHVLVIPIGSHREMQKDAIKRFGHIGIDFLQIRQAMMKDDVAILRGKHARGRVGLSKKIRYQQIPFAGQVDQDVPDAEKIISEDVFTVAVIEIEIDPSVVAVLTIDKDMIAPDVAVFLAPVVKKPDRFDAGC